MIVFNFIFSDVFRDMCIFFSTIVNQYITINKFLLLKFKLYLRTKCSKL